MKEWKAHFFTFKGTIVAIIGWFAIVIAALATLGFIFSGFDSDSIADIVGVIIAIILLYLVGFLCLRYRKKCKTLNLLYKKYSPLLANRSDGSLDNMAAAAGMSYDTVKADIQKLIDTGCFPGYYIDVQRRSVVKPFFAMGESSAAQTSAFAMDRNAATRTVKCPNCGGINTVVVGSNSVCEYCGSPIK